MVVELLAAKGFLSEIATASGARHVGDDTYISRLVTHSAEVTAGDLFCAIKDKRDGSLFIKEAVENGAAAVLCDTPPPVSIPYLLATDTLSALEKWARSVRTKSNARCIAITGSVGKTGTKNALYAMLCDFFRTHATKENYNNRLGVCLTLLSMPEDTELLICEVGTNHMGEIHSLSKIVRPNDAIITSVGRAHIEAFGTREGIAKEKLSILDGMHAGGHLFVPFDEKLLESAKAGIMSIPVYPKEDCLPDAASAWALGFAEKISHVYGIPDEEIQKRLPKAKEACSRRIEQTVGKILFIDDAYNAAPESMQNAFLYLSSRAKGRRVLVLGDMLELGEHSPKIHFEIGSAAALHAELILLFGACKEDYQRGIGSAKTKTRTVFLQSETPHDIAEEILSYLTPYDTVLFKAAHALGAKDIYRALTYLLQKEKGI